MPNKLDQARGLLARANRNGERVSHGEIYKSRPEVSAVCHHHGPSILPFCIRSPANTICGRDR